MKDILLASEKIFAFLLLSHFATRNFSSSIFYVFSFLLTFNDHEGPSQREG